MNVPYCARLAGAASSGAGTAGQAGAGGLMLAISRPYPGNILVAGPDSYDIA